MSATTTFTSPSYGLDPDIVACATEDPSGTIVLLTYGVDSAVARIGLGSYTCTVPVESPGTYTANWSATDQADASSTQTF